MNLESLDEDSDVVTISSSSNEPYLNRGYNGSKSDIHLSDVNETSSENGHVAVPIFNALHETSISAPHHEQQQTRLSQTNLGPYEQQESLVDPNSDRVTTVLVWQNLVVSAKEDDKNRFLQSLKGYKNYVPKKKQLLVNVSGAITGGLWAVMGPSGSGKSTLLNTLACRLDVNTTYTGEMRLNGAAYDNAELKRIAGYVMQDDMLNGHLTVEETLNYTAELRLPRHVTREQRNDRVRDVMNDMGLVHVKNVIIGTPLKKGISGGERKRLCVGMQLLSRPQLLFLDEPTSGLDSVTALDLLGTLHDLAHGKSQEKAVTVVCSIHQPQSKIFDLFDSVILLKQGNILYQGPREQAMEVFKQAGYPCPLYTNPADHLLDVVTPPRDGASDTSEKQALIDSQILQAQTPIQVDLNLGADKRLLYFNVPKGPPWFTQVRILLRRTLQEQFRKRDILIASLVQTVIMAVLIGTVFLKIGIGQRSVIRRQPVLFFCSVNQGVFGALTVINTFPVERALTLRERASGTYFASAYFIAKIIVETLVQLPMPIIFSIVVYFLIGLQPTAGKFFIFMLFMLLCSMASTSLALMISAICKTTDLSVTVLPMALEVSRLFGGFFLAPANLPKYFAWLDALSYVKYTYVGVSLNELSNLHLTCTAANIAAGSCVKVGETTIKTLGFDYIPLGGCIGAILAYIIVCRVIAFLGVRFLKS
ncbi:unnamed protein product [Didymodactylos carnosus]|uniref:ABC transporter domain-containing protein n=1 Tax=Didymodactylos carnosus TaxID=1234261 RepID=A0A813TIU8_9BILA|nr:unnamed protein product [Didymodactylos carnosus]CAF3601182.1 unnamed protein product [Didymodactylos carnosus]